MGWWGWVGRRCGRVRRSQLIILNLFFQALALPSLLLHAHAWAYFLELLVRLVYGGALLASLLVPQAQLAGMICGWIYAAGQFAAHLIAFWMVNPTDQIECFPKMFRIINVLLDESGRLILSKTFVYGVSAFYAILFLLYPVMSSIPASAIKRSFRPFIKVEDDDNEAAFSKTPQI